MPAQFVSIVHCLDHQTYTSAPSCGGNVSCHNMQEGAGQGPDWSWGTCHIPRGDLQTTFLFKGFDEARRLGLNRDTEARVRAALAADTAGVSAPGGSYRAVLPCTADSTVRQCVCRHSCMASSILCCILVHWLICQIVKPVVT